MPGSGPGSTTTPAHHWPAQVEVPPPAAFGCLEQALHNAIPLCGSNHHVCLHAGTGMVTITYPLFCHPRTAEEPQTIIVPNHRHSSVRWTRSPCNLICRRSPARRFWSARTIFSLATNRPATPLYGSRPPARPLRALPNTQNWRDASAKMSRCHLFPHPKAMDGVFRTMFLPPHKIG